VGLGNLSLRSTELLVKVSQLIDIQEGAFTQHLTQKHPSLLMRAEKVPSSVSKSQLE